MKDLVNNNILDDNMQKKQMSFVLKLSLLWKPEFLKW